MPLPDSIRDRIELFARNEEQYRDPSYKEAQLRQEFLDPFFAALGWDMENKAGHAEPYKDVIHEGAIKIARSAMRLKCTCQNKTASAPTLQVAARSLINSRASA